MNSRQPPIANHLVWAILVTLFCCLPLGIVAIVYAAKVDSLAAAGQYAEAQDAADKAKWWSLASAFSLVGLIVLYVLFVMLLGLGGAVLGA